MDQALSYQVSIHAPLRGATTRSGTPTSLTKGFNPRTPAGCDFRSVDQALSYQVSIHAPLRGATKTPFHFFSSREFQSTHPCGVRRPGRRSLCDPACVSIHAPLRGATFALSLYRTRSHSFNPRTPAGCDYFSKHLDELELEVSIHAPLRGATVPARKA